MAPTTTRTRKQAADRVEDLQIDSVEDLLLLDHYEFDQWCALTAKGRISEEQREWLRTELILVDRWVDGLESLIDSADTQLEHAEAELEDLRAEAADANDDDIFAELAELESFQRSWRPKIHTFQRKIRKTLREARRVQRQLRAERSINSEAREILDAIKHHKEETLRTYEEGSPMDEELWSLLG